MPDHLNNDMSSLGYFPSLHFFICPSSSCALSFYLNLAIGSQISLLLSSFFSFDLFGMLSLWLDLSFFLRTWKRHRQKSGVITPVSASSSEASWSLCPSPGPVSGTSVCPPIHPSAPPALTDSCSPT